MEYVVVTWSGVKGQKTPAENALFYTYFFNRDIPSQFGVEDSTFSGILTRFKQLGKEPRCFTKLAKSTATYWIF